MGTFLKKVSQIAASVAALASLFMAIGKAFEAFHIEFNKGQKAKDETASN